MKLTNAQVTKYKCVENSNPFQIDQVTCLVGKNEAGKSAILEALYRLNPVEESEKHLSFGSKAGRMAGF